MIQGAKARRSQQMKQMVAKMEGRCGETLIWLNRTNWFKLLQKRVLYKQP